MNNSIELAKLLVDRKILAEGTTISAKVSTVGFGYAAMTTIKQGVVVQCFPEVLVAMYDDKKKRKTAYEDIIAIEGMEIERFAQAYRIKTNSKKV